MAASYCQHSMSGVGDACCHQRHRAARKQHLLHAAQAACTPAPLSFSRGCAAGTALTTCCPRARPWQAHVTAAFATEVEQSTPTDVHLDTQNASHSPLSQAEAESLEVLEWPAVSLQVARLCGTVLGAQRVATEGLPLGSSLAHSRLLQQQTQEALDTGLTVTGVYDLSPALAAVSAGAYLNAKQLEGIGKSLAAALQVRAAVCAVSGDGSLLCPGLADLAAGIQQEEAATLTAIQQCIQLGSVSDQASASLATVRAERRANADTLRTLMDDTARMAFQKGAADSRAVSLVRSRYCIGIKAGRQSDLPKGSVKLGASQTGATQYWEPAPAIPLNNAAALLASQEEQEETAVLVLLAQLLLSRAEALEGLMEAVTQLDMVAARAAHARVFQGVQPELLDTAAVLHSWQQGQGAVGSQGSSLLWVPGAQHPLLLERALPAPLPEPPSLDANRFERNFAPPPVWETQRSAVGAPGNGSGGAAVNKGPPPQALDLRVPPNKAVVAVTGPNTGGKTVCLKTLGLMALMAKAGMFLTSQQQHPRPTVAWFSSVLADIGDAQSLQQSLSTFSGHIRRIKAVLAAVEPGSLVLLDEVGSGTDPVEGAALARAILDKLADRAALTVATTHHAELKVVADEDSRYVNVSMEFNTVSLKPTYRLQWGAVGASNALSIARTLGFDSSVLRDAEVVARTVLEAQSDRSARMAATAASLIQQTQDTEQEVREARERTRASQARLQALRDRLSELSQMQQQLLGPAPKAIVRQRDKLRDVLDCVITEYSLGQTDREAVDQQLKLLEDQIPEKIAAIMRQITPGDYVPVPGDVVVVPHKYGEDQFTVDRLQGTNVLLTPNSVMGTGMALLSLKSNKKTTRISMPVRDVKVVLRAGQA